MSVLELKARKKLIVAVEARPACLLLDVFCNWYARRHLTKLCIEWRCVLVTDVLLRWNFQATWTYENHLKYKENMEREIEKIVLNLIKLEISIMTIVFFVL